MEINGYNLTNEEKVRRAIEGSPTSEGTPTGGVGLEEDKDGNVTNGDIILAQYDKLGGLILNADNRKVKTGSFFDFKANAPLKKPNVVLLIKVGDQEVEVPEGDAMPIEVQAAEILADKKATKKVAKVKGGKAKKVEVPEDAEDSE